MSAAERSVPIDAVVIVVTVVGADHDVPVAVGERDPDPVEDVLAVGAEHLADRPGLRAVGRQDRRAVDDGSPADQIGVGHVGLLVVEGSSGDQCDKGSR